MQGTGKLDASCSPNPEGKRKMGGALDSKNGTMALDRGPAN